MFPYIVLDGAHCRHKCVHEWGTGKFGWAEILVECSPRSESPNWQYLVSTGARTQYKSLATSSMSVEPHQLILYCSVSFTVRWSLLISLLSVSSNAVITIIVSSVCPVVVIEFVAVRRHCRWHYHHHIICVLRHCGVLSRTWWCRARGGPWHAVGFGGCLIGRACAACSTSTSSSCRRGQAAACSARC